MTGTGDLTIGNKLFYYTTVKKTNRFVRRAAVE